MSQWRRSLLASATLAIAAMLLAAMPAAADCGLAPFPQQVGAYRGTAFIGRVTSSAPTELQYRDRRPSEEIRVTFKVERPITGIDRERISVIGGEKSGCTIFWASELAVGDRVLISFPAPTDEDQYDLAANTHIAWRALVWRPTGDGGWRFADDAVLDPEDHPDVARAADSLAEILALVAPGLPPTDAAPSGHGSDIPEWLLLAVGVAGGALALRRVRGRPA